MSIEIKIEKLKELFKSSDRVIVAYSGGVDSTFLLYALVEFVGIEARAVTIKTPYIPQWEVDEAKAFCDKYHIEHKIIELQFPNSIITNPEDRCYKCKMTLFSQITDYATSEGFNIVADGSNADDIKDYRPGLKALKELKIMSPLLETGITKPEIRNLLKEVGLEIWNKPAYACLLTRIPHNTKVDEKMLYLVEEAELYIKDIGFPGTRVRLHRDIARLESNPENLGNLCSEPVRNKIVLKLKQLGIKYVTIDMEGYRTGSMNL